MAQHIPSSYSAFFRDRYTKYRESFKKAIMPRVTYQVNVEDPCVWDYLVCVQLVVAGLVTMIFRV
ncbi:hypothetical protein IBC70_09200 [Bifidobacterium longum subsp. longum]|nr:hypothetical protein [Bifidobacterium longum subsp. longum]